MIDPIAPALDTDATRFAAHTAARLAEAELALQRYKALPRDAAFLDVVEAYDAIARPLDAVGGLAHLFFQAHPDAEVRATAAAFEQDLGRFTTALSLDREVYDRLAALDPDAAPDPVSGRIVEHAQRDFRRAGVDREHAVRDSVRALREELVTIGQEFARNIASDVRSITIPEGREGLAGLPEDWIESHRPGPDGSVVVTTDPPDYSPFMKYCCNRDKRRELQQQYATRGAPANLAVLDRMLARRHELATLLGYESWADYITEDKMIRSAENASAFIKRVLDLTEGKVDEEVAELLSTVREDHPDETALRDFDRAFYTERARTTRCGFDAKQARPYFSYERVTQGVMDTAARLYGLSFEEVQLPLWHADVRAFDVTEEGRAVARLFLDMHPRAEKFKHAAMFELVSGCEGDRIPQACLVCNFPRPDGEDAGLMEPRDVVTYFHEFGHLLHHLLSGEHRWVSVSGIATEWDFVEVPSQLFEEWARDTAVLQCFARHHQTDEPIPAEMVAAMRKADDYAKALNTRTQMFYAALSLEYYSGDPAGRDTTETMKTLRSRHLPFAPYEEGTCFQASFGHLDGYTALYYTYMWSLVLAKDVFGVFAGDIMNRQTASRYRQAILAPGGSKDAAQLVQDFLGRDSGFEAFERWLAA